jgi:hypothetical protein
MSIYSGSQTATHGSTLGTSQTGTGPTSIFGHTISSQLELTNPIKILMKEYNIGPELSPEYVSILKQNIEAAVEVAFDAKGNPEYDYTLNSILKFIDNLSDTQCKELKKFLVETFAKRKSLQLQVKLLEINLGEVSWSAMGGANMHAKDIQFLGLDQGKNTSFKDCILKVIDQELYNRMFK